MSQQDQPQSQSQTQQTPPEQVSPQDSPQTQQEGIPQPSSPLSAKVQALLNPKPKQPPSPEAINAEALRELLEETRARRANQREAEKQAPQGGNKGDILGDPLGFLMGQGLTADEAKMAIVHAVYGLNPEGAEVPVDVKLKLAELRQAKALREHQQELEKRQAETATKQAEEARQSALMQFELLGRGLETSPYQASAAFYDNPSEYAQAMAHWAQLLYTAATEQGEELPTGQDFVQLVQQAVEDQVGSRLTKAQQRQAARQAVASAPEPEAKPTVKGVPSATKSTPPAPSTRTGKLTKEEADKMSSSLLAGFMK